MTDLFSQPTFEDWYEVYPRKIGKKAAQTAYKRALRESSPQSLQDAVVAYAAIQNELTGYQGKKGKAKNAALEFICHPATWLNQGRWEDEIIEEYLSRPEAKPEEPIIFDEYDQFKEQKTQLLKVLGPATWRSWFSDLEIATEADEKGRRIIAGLPTKFFRDYIKKTYAAEFEEVFHTQVRFEVSQSMIRKNEELCKGERA